MLLEWLSDAEMKLRFAATLPEDDLETKNQLLDHEKYVSEVNVFIMFISTFFIFSYAIKC